MPAHPFEPELSWPAPRRVRMRHPAVRWAIGCFWLFLAPFIIIGLVLAVRAVSATAILLLGRTTDAQLLESRDQSGEDSSGYRLTYLYRVGGRAYRGTDDVSGGCGEGEPLRVAYAPWDPGRGSIPLPGKASLGADVGGRWFFALFWNAILFPFLWLFFVAPARRRALVARGQPSAGTIVGKEPGTSDDGKPSGGTLRYEFVPEGYGSVAGERLRGSEQVDLADFESVSIGHSLTILYDPAKPARNTAYRFSVFEALPP